MSLNDLGRLFVHRADEYVEALALARLEGSPLTACTAEHLQKTAQQYMEVRNLFLGEATKKEA